MAAISLDYQADLRGRRQRLVGRLCLLFVVVALGVAGYCFGPDAYRYVQHRRWYAQCGTHRLPTEAVVYDETADGAARLLAQGPEYGPPGRILFNTRDSTPPPGWTSPAEHHPDVLWRIHPQRRRSGIVLLHRRLTQTGAEHVVIVTVESSAWGRAPAGHEDTGRTVGFSAALLGAPQWRKGFAPPATSLPGTWHVRVAHDQRVRVYAGQPDAADASHFTIEYEIVGEKRRRTVDGWLLDPGLGSAATQPWRQGPSVEFREREQP